MKTFVLSWNNGATARAISEKISPLKGRLLSKKPESVTKRLNRNSLVLNLGCQLQHVVEPDLQGDLSLLNHSSAVSLVANKLTLLQVVQEHDLSHLVVPWTTDLTQAQQWIQENQWKVVQRAVLGGSSGKGISIHDDADTLQQAPLYTRYINKTDEYRVHVFKGVVLDVQRKARDTSVPDDAVNWQVRNHDNGFIFMREGVTPDTVPPAVIQNSLAVVQCTGLDFGAVDVIWNSTHNKAYVLEVNSSPGMTGTTLDKFCAAVQAYAVGQSVEQWS